jgi:hypothetical protein
MHPDRDEVAGKAAGGSENGNADDGDH